MAIYYACTFGILVTEMVLFGLLVLPLPSRWRHAMLTFASTSPLVAKAMYGLKIIFGFIFILFVDTITRLYRIESEVEGDNGRPRPPLDFSFQANQRANRFYTQRNLYLTGFTLFLSVILERTSALVLELLQREKELKNAKLENAESSKSQQKLISMEDDYKKKIDVLNVQLKELQKDSRDFETLKKQAEQQSAEYNRLADEFNKLEKKFAAEANEAKKDI